MPRRSLPFTNEFTKVSAPLWTAAHDPESASEPERSRTSMALTSLRETCAVAEMDKVFQCRIFIKYVGTWTGAAIFTIMVLAGPAGKVMTVSGTGETASQLSGKFSGKKRFAVSLEGGCCCVISVLR